MVQLVLPMNKQCSQMSRLVTQTFIGVIQKALNEVPMISGQNAPPNRKFLWDSSKWFARVEEDFEYEHILDFLRAIVHNLSF